MPPTTNKKDLVKIDTETLRIIEDKQYRSFSGNLVSLNDSLDFAISNTILYSPGDLVEANDIIKQESPQIKNKSFDIEITDETTSAAGERLSNIDDNVVILNFASAKNPGGGFLHGARAQEEDLTRKSGLYACLKPQSAYYTANKKSRSCLYTDHLIYSPKVPFFRDDNLALVDEPYLLSVITSPAPNAGEELQKNPKSSPQILEVLDRRAKDILLAAKINNHRTLVLGAWGCGVFRNNPIHVSKVFLKHLEHDDFNGCFDTVVFAIYDLYPEKTLSKVFKETFKDYVG